MCLSEVLSSFIKLRIVKARRCGVARQRSSTLATPGLRLSSRVKLSSWRGTACGKRRAGGIRGQCPGIPLRGGSGTSDGTPSAALGETPRGDRLRFNRVGDPNETSTASPRLQSDVREVDGALLPLSPRRLPRTLLPPHLSAQVPSSPSSSVQLPPVNSSSDKSCMQPREPLVTQGNYAHLIYDELRDPCRRRGYARKDSEAVHKLGRQ